MICRTMLMNLNISSNKDVGVVAETSSIIRGGFLHLLQRRPRLLSFQIGIYRVLVLGVLANVNCEAVKLNHWHRSECGVWMQMLGLQQSDDLTSLISQGYPRIFCWKTNVPLNFSGLTHISSKRCDCTYMVVPPDVAS